MEQIVKPERPVAALARVTNERDAARKAIKMVFDMVEHGDLDIRHDTYEGDECPQDDTCACRVRRLLLEVQIAGGIDPNGARAVLDKLPPAGPHDRADCPCGHPLGTQGVCGGCNCADGAP